MNFPAEYSTFGIWTSPNVKGPPQKQIFSPNARRSEAKTRFDLLISKADTFGGGKLCKFYWEILKNSKVCLDKSDQGPVCFETSPILIMGAFLAAATAATVLKLACAWRSEWWYWRSRCAGARGKVMEILCSEMKLNSSLFFCKIYFFLLKCSSASEFTLKLPFLDPPMIHRTGDLHNLPRPMRWDHLVRLSSSKVSGHWSSRWHPFLFHQHPDRFSL